MGLLKSESKDTRAAQSGMHYHDAGLAPKKRIRDMSREEVGKVREGLAGARENDESDTKGMSKKKAKDYIFEAHSETGPADAQSAGFARRSAAKYAKKSQDDFDLEKTSRDSKIKAARALDRDERHPAPVGWSSGGDLDDIKSEYIRRAETSGKNKKQQENIDMPGGDPETARAVRADMRRSVDSFLNKSFENRTVLPELIIKGYPESLKQKDKEERDHTDPMYKPKKAEGARMKAEDRADAAKEPKLERSYTIDEMTVATLLKGHPDAQEILDELLKGKKKNESGEEFQDGSEDTIGGEGHAAVARPDSIKHEGKPSGIGPNEPGTGTKKASIEDGDLSKSDFEYVGDYKRRNEGYDLKNGRGGVRQHSESESRNPKTIAHDDAAGKDDKGRKLYFKESEYDKKTDKMKISSSPEEGRTRKRSIPANAAHEKELKNASQNDFDLEKAIEIVGDFLMEKGYDIDETNEIIEEYFGLEKSDNLADNLPDEFEDEMEDDDTIPPEKNAKKSMTADEEILSHLLKTMGADRMEEILKAVVGGSSVDPAKRRMLAQMPGAYKAAPSEEDNPLTNKKVNLKALAALKQGVGTGGAAKSEESDLEKSEDNMSEEYSLDFSKSIMERMGLEKGATSVSKEAGGGKATQINYGSKPTTRFKHPKAKSDKKYIHNPAKGTVNVEKEGEKTREIGVSEESKLKNASVSSADLYKSLDAILDKKRD